MTAAISRCSLLSKLILNGANLCPSGVRAAIQIPDILKYLALSARGIFDKGVTGEKEMLGLMVTQPHIHRSWLLALTMPVLVIAGTDDMIRQSHTKTIAGSIKYGELCLVEGDHFIAARNPEAFNRKTEEFLQKSLPEGGSLPKRHGGAGRRLEKLSDIVLKMTEQMFAK